MVDSLGALSFPVILSEAKNLWSRPFFTSAALDAGRDQRFFVPQNDGIGGARQMARARRG